MDKINDNIKFALICTIMSIALFLMLERRGLYNFADVQMFVFFTFAILSIIFKEFGCFIYKILSRIVHFLGKYFAIVALFFVYILTILPTGIVMKIVKRDRLRLKKIETDSYWIKYDNQNSDYENQF